jgi:mannose-6-phosphate isomerase-like protein (cupin superfamily)
VPRTGVPPTSVRADTDDLAEFLGVVALRLGRATEARTNPPAGPGARAWRCLSANSVYDAWLVEWGPRSGLDLHDHGGSTGAFVVVEGHLIETFRDIDDDVFTVQRVDVGDVVTLSETRVHEVRNRSTGTARSVHVYSPPLSAMNFYDPATA